MTGFIFRNVNAPPDQPVSEWPLEAIQTALERGSLFDWRRLAAETQERPWGHVARSIEEVLTYSRPYGVPPLMERVIASARENATRVGPGGGR